MSDNFSNESQKEPNHPNSSQIDEEPIFQNVDYNYIDETIAYIQDQPYSSEILDIINNNYILPSNLASRDDIQKYYYIYPKTLEHGGISRIFMAENNYGKFAIKCIPKNNLKKIDHVLNEAIISRKLQHENIVYFYESFEDFDNIYFVMELCENGDLVNLLEQSPEGCVSPNLVIDIMLQIFGVVDYLHSINIIHRDLKLENCLMKFDLNKKIIIKLTDFGVSTFKPEKGRKLYEIIGTDKIEAPEMLSGKGYDEKIDEWALGVIMYNLLTGREVFIPGPKIRNYIMYGHINFKIIKDVELRNLVEMLLNRNVSYRISAKEAMKILEEIKLKRDIRYKKWRRHKSEKKFLKIGKNAFLINENNIKIFKRAT